MDGMRVRLGLLVMLVLLFGAGAVHAQPALDQGRAAKSEPTFVSQAWSWMTSLFGQAGSFIDPLGHDGPTVAPGSTNRLDAGSFIDPLGGG
jgi:hypothetical protein